MWVVVDATRFVTAEERAEPVADLFAGIHHPADLAGDPVDGLPDGRGDARPETGQQKSATGRQALDLSCKGERPGP